VTFFAVSDLRRPLEREESAMRIVGVSVPVLICILCVSAAAGAQDLGEALVVTVTRTPEANAPSNVTVIEGAAIRDSKALDEALRADPSFGLFRRNSSLVADPSSQGVTLRVSLAKISVATLDVGRRSSQPAQQCPSYSLCWALCALR